MAAPRGLSTLKLVIRGQSRGELASQREGEDVMEAVASASTRSRPGPGAPAAALGGGRDAPLSPRHPEASAGPSSAPRAAPGPVQYMGLTRMK